MFNQKLMPVPEAFHCQKTGAPFSHCLVCDEPIGPGTLHLIEKAFRSGDTLYEYAMCFQCYQTLRGDMSISSLEAIDVFFDQRAEFELRQAELMAISPDRVDPWIAECIVSRQPIEPDSEYQVFAFCRGSDMMLDRMPYAIGNEAVEELYELLSPKTREEMDRFTEDHLGLPPEMLRRPVDRPVTV